MSESNELIKSDDEFLEPDEVERAIISYNPRAFEGVKKEKKQELLKTVSAVMVTTLTSREHSGPLPDPETLHGYNQLIPNGADRVMIMAEKNQEHRHQLQKTVVDKKLSHNRTGQYLGFLIGLVGIGCGTFLAANGNTTVGGIIAGGTVVSLVSVFVIGKKFESKDSSNEN